MCFLPGLQIGTVNTKTLQNTKYQIREKRGEALTRGILQVVNKHSFLNETRLAMLIVTGKTLERRWQVIMEAPSKMFI